LTTKIDDHVLLLQLERQYDAVEERVKGLEDVDADYCDCNCHEDDADRLEMQIENTRKDMQGDIDVLSDRIHELEEKFTELVHTLRGRGIPA